MRMIYDVIIVGGGHAGIEAASSAAKMGASVLLITMNMKNIGQMSCNPAMGGIAKGQIIREIDALGGLSGIITDNTMIQFRMLNISKGPAMWSPRAQSDREKFTKTWRYTLEKIKNLDLYQDTVIDIIVKNYKIQGVKTILGIEIKSKSVILTNGTFLNGLIFVGNKKMHGGRIAEKNDKNITNRLKELGFYTGRMKTGTSPRVDGRTLNYQKMIEQFGDKNPKQFSFTFRNKLINQISCYITYSNEKVHQIIKYNLDKSPQYNGLIKSIGPRYCPSIEDKVLKFTNKNKHQIYVEPEGRNTYEVYVNGFSTSLPYEVQYNALRQIKGFENVKILKFGYAIEYDYFAPIQLKHTLETKNIKNLFFAGQINGTTGYEEAAAQGIIAGINSYLKINKKEPFILKRNEAYIGVLIDDLVSKGTNEPYRMFTSRAEHRIILRQDNADERLTPYGYKLGLIDNNRFKQFNKKMESIRNCINFLHITNILPESINLVLLKKNSNIITTPLKIDNILSRPQIYIKDIDFISQIKSYIKTNNLYDEILDQVSLKIKYSGYIKKEKEYIDKIIRFKSRKIPKNFYYNKIKSLSYEAKEKLSFLKPKSIGEASRISGVSPSDIIAIIISI
jgi:tRNA uridine 5-carboxymethylaminomethyl modification enzyme